MLLYLVNAIDRICCACMILMYLSPLLLYRYVYMEEVSHMAYYIMYFLGIVYFCI